MDQITVDTPPGLRQGGEFGQLREEEIAEQQSAQSRNNNNNNNNNNNSQESNEQPTDSHNRDETIPIVNEYGFDKIKPKRSDTSRFVFINHNGIPKRSTDIMNRSLLSAINQSEADVVGIAEHNCNFKAFAPKDQWHERTQEWWEASKSTVSTNKHDVSTSKYLPGGTITVALNKACHRAQRTDTPIDPTGLGRWSSIVFRGSHGIVLRVITAYRVCQQQYPGPNTSAAQHHRYMLLQGDTRHSRDAILQDLKTSVLNFHEAGEQIILMMDCNEDVRCEEMQEMMHSMGLREVITENRPADAQATHHNNRSNIPIDGIFMSASLTMLRGGYLPFGFFDSDHRAIWIDVTNANLFGFHIKDVPRHLSRRMKCDLPWVKNKFQHDYKQILRSKNLHQRIYDLQTLATYQPWNEAMSMEFNAIMKEREYAILQADKKCRKLCMGQVSFSADYDIARKSIELWKGVVKRKKGQKFSNTKIRTLARQLGIESPNNCTLEEAIRKRDLIFRDYFSKVKKNADALRTTFLEKKAAQISTEQGGEASKILLQLRDKERLRKINRRIDWTLEKHKGSGVTKITVEDDQGVDRDITSQSGIESACMKEFEKKFRQTEDTPSMREPWRSILGYDGKTQGATDILNGTLTFPEGTSEYTKDYFREMRREPTIHKPAPPATMETTSYQQGWHNMKERTSAGLSGITFGHMKACSQDEELANFEATISHIPYSTGFVPDLWKRGVCCMLPKKANSDKVTDLRTIVLQECEYNFNNKKIGKEAMRHAEDNNFIAPEQYGGRKGKRSIDHVLNKRLTYDLMRFSRRPGALCSNDAKSCYDRVLHSIVSIAFRRLGFPTPPIDCMIKCIQQMKYYIRTTFGTSSASFSSQHTAIPIMGLLQGNGAGPTIWVLVSTPLLNMLRTADKGAHLLSAISKEPAHFVGFAFVDDTDLVTFRADDFTITDDEIFEDMQESIDRWEEGLKITGGAIVPSKSWVYPISFEFSEDGLWKYKSMLDNDFQFSVKDHRGIRQILQQHEVDIGTETLGVILAPDGNNKAAVRKLRHIAEKWFALVKVGHLQPDETFLATNSRIMKSLSYCLPATTFSKKECDFILAPVLKASLARTHICSTFPRAVVFGPISELGLGYSDLYTIQGVSQLNSVTHYLPMIDDITGKLLRSNFEAAKVDIGLGGDFVMYDYKTFSLHLTNSWIKSMWEFINYHSISFSESVTGDHSLKRENDQYIMFKIIQLSKYGKKNLLRINACRLYLQVYSLSDITTGDGARFTNEAWICQRDPLRRTNLLWPRQPRPNGKSRRLWKQAIKLAFPRNVNSQFLSPLGYWTDFNSRDLCTWFFHRDTSSVYRRFGNDWKKYRRRGRRGQLGQFPRLIYEGNAFSLPPNSVRATVETVNRHLRLTGWAHDIANLLINNLPLTSKYQQSLVKARINMKTDCQYQRCTEYDIAQHIFGEEISLVSDGSFLQEAEWATAAWIIAISRTRYKIGRHCVTGNAIDQGSHRGELSGILGGILDINQICENHAITNGRAKLHCDGLGAVSMVSFIEHKLSPSHAHFDILHSIFRALQLSPLKWSFHHVYGHQDDVTSIHDLSEESFYNTLADEYAKSKLQEILNDPIQSNDRPYILPFRLCTTNYIDREGNNFSIDSKFSHTLSYLISKDRIQNYWISKGVFPQDHTNSFNRLIASKAMQRLSGNKRRWISKWCTGILGTGMMLQRWKQQDHSLCPRCQLPNETALHCIQCQHPSVTTLWEESIFELQTWMLGSKGHPDFVQIFCSSLTAWRTNIPVDRCQYGQNIRLAFNDQHRLGWERIFYGIWSQQWISIQQQHLLQIGSRKSAILWLATVQHKLWIILFDLWDQRNHVLHVINQSLHPHELTAIHEEITQAMQTPLHIIPQSQRYLFHDSVEAKLRWSISMKIQWLISVRRSQRHFYPLLHTPLPVWAETVTQIIHRWQRKGNVRL